MTVRALGLDLSTSSTGLATPDGTTHTIRPIAKEPARRLHEIISRLEPFLTLHRPIDLAVIEVPVNARGGVSTVVALAEVAGAVKVRLFDHVIPYVLVAPSTLKLFATGYGGSSKRPVTKDDMVTAAVGCGIQPKNDDEAEAWLLQSMARMWFDAWEPAYRADEVREVRRRVLSAVKWPRVEVRV